MTSTAGSAAVRGDTKGLFGHPKGLAYLAFTEVWERFSFYGMSALLLLYMIHHLFTPAVSESVRGLAGLRTAIESLTGPLSDQAFASQILSLYTGLVYLTPIFGGLLADRLLGQRYTVVIGALLMMAGHLLMAFEAQFLIALALLIAGTGCLKGNISVQVGHLYPPEDDGRRTRAFAIFSAAINVGALFGPLACGILAQRYGWHVGFATAGALMLIALLTYLAGWNYLAPDRRRHRDALATSGLARHDWRIIGALILLGVTAVLPFAAYYQEMNAGLLFIEKSVDRQLLGWTVPTASFNALDGLFCIMAVPTLIFLWRRQARQGKEPGDLSRIAIGYLIIAIANMMMTLPAAAADEGETVGAIWVIALYGLNALGFTFFWPTLLALYSRVAPKQVNATMMGAIFLSAFLGNMLVGALAGLWEKISHASFFALHAALAFAAFLIVLALARPLGRCLRVDANHVSD